MYLSQASISNFRKVKQSVCVFNPGLNLIVGSNDSGKTALVDAIRIVLRQVVDDYIKLQIDDFADKAKEVEIQMTFSFDDAKSEDDLIECSSHFAEYLSFRGDQKPELKIWYTAKPDERGIRFPSFRVGPTKETAIEMDAYCREKLKVVYLRPLRDAESELRAKQGSRISRILREHDDVKSSEAEFEGMLQKFSDSIEQFFSTGGSGKDIMKEVSRLLDLFDEQKYLGKKDVKFGPTENIDHIKALERISLYYDTLKKPGLGTLNMIFIAAELLHLNTQKSPNILLIEEIEAHLHPQRQLKIITALQNESKKGIQMILTTHSPNLASLVDIERLCAANDGEVYSLAKGTTKLSDGNYAYLRRFLSATRSNLFFAQGVLLVEGTTEQLLLPEFAKILGYDLVDRGLSIVSTNGLGFDNFINIFKRLRPPYNKIPVAVLTDADLKSAAKMKTYKDGSSDVNNRVECFMGDQLSSEADISKGRGTTFEKLILANTKELRQIYLAAYNSRKKKKKAFLKEDAATEYLYARIKKAKAVLAQDVAQKISELYDSQDGKIDVIKKEISENLSYIEDAIKFVLSPNNGD